MVDIEPSPGHSVIMPSEKRAAIRAAREKKINDAVDVALSQKPASTLKAVIEEIESYSRLLAATELPWAKDTWAAISIAVTVIILAGLLWSLKTSRSSVSLVAKTDHIHGSLDQDWSLQDALTGQVMRLDHLSALHDASLGIDIDDAEANIWCNLEGRQLALQAFHISHDADLGLVSQNGELRFLSVHSPLEGEILLIGKVTVTIGIGGETGPTREYDLPIPEMVTFSVTGKHSAGTELDIHGVQPWSLGLMPYRALSFNYEIRSLADRQLFSGLHSGTLQFNDTSWPTIQIPENQLVSLPDTGKARIHIRGAEDLISVTADGPVGHVAIGDAAGVRELAPSYLEYLYNRKSLLLFWAAVTAGWGLLWGVRKTIFR